MRGPRITTVLAALAALLAPNALAAGGPLPIRVLVQSAPSARLTFPAVHTAFFADGKVLARSTTPLEWRLAVGANGKISVEAKGGVLYDTGRERLLFEAPPAGAFALGGKPYRGSASVIARGRSLDVINVLDLEEYVRGVVPVEMPSGWPDEALKAQAVIARTYAIARLGSAGDHDVCATTACQVYGGASVETARADAAAAATRGIIASYAGRPARTFFHADSGGYTASSREVWGEDVPYLVARPDPGSRSPRSPWTASPAAGLVASAVARLAPGVGRLRSLAVSARTESGRIDGLALGGDQGTAVLSGAVAREFARAIGAQSTLLVVSSNAPLTLQGTGWGHGVGLSQWGARSLAIAGWTYDQILAYYYTGVALSNYVTAD